ncbi:MAG: ABC transporter ATP-binding protein [Planctomycetes bacterium]|nr:ABC transporter ATP-binding protein [Planctomycetota bacterium]
MGDAPIRVEGLTKHYRGRWGRRVEALRNLTLSVEPGEIFGLLGPNGSGKTTTLKLLTGLLRPTSGRAWMLGKPAGDPQVRSRIGFLPEESYFYRFLTAAETLDFFGRLFGLGVTERRRRADALLEEFGLAEARHRAVGTFSKGMARRLGLASTLLNDPELVLLDEPTSGLDPMGTREVKDLILRLKARGKTVLVCSHLLADIERICDRIAILAGGSLRILGRVSDLLARRDAVQMTVRGLGEGALDALRAQARALGGEVLSVEPPRDRLEDLFLSVVRGPSAGGKSS